MLYISGARTKGARPLSTTIWCQTPFHHHLVPDEFSQRDGAGRRIRCACRLGQRRRKRPLPSQRRPGVVLLQALQVGVGVLGSALRPGGVGQEGEGLLGVLGPTWAAPTLATTATRPRTSLNLRSRRRRSRGFLSGISRTWRDSRCRLRQCIFRTVRIRFSLLRAPSGTRGQCWKDYTRTETASRQ